MSAGHFPDYAFHTKQINDCWRHIERLDDWQRGFVERVKRQIEDGNGMSLKQAEKLDEIWERAMSSQLGRRLIPGKWSHEGFAVRTDMHRATLVACTGGGCNQGRTPEHCDCELACDVAPDFYRSIKAPTPPAEPNHRARAAAWALGLVAAGYLFLAGLLAMCGSRSFE